MDMTTAIGIAGGVILVLGAAWPDTKGVKPIRSVKDWLFALGGLIMLIYSTLNYFAGGSIFYVFLQGLVNLSSIFMMTEIDDRIDTPILSLATVALIIWSLLIQPSLVTVLFILGLAGIAIGYALNGGTVKREAALFAGSALIALFSYIEASWIFFWLNIFFAAFSLLQIVKMKRHR